MKNNKKNSENDLKSKIVIDITIIVSIIFILIILNQYIFKINIKVNTAENKNSNVALNKKAYNPIVPDGFKKVDTANAKWESSSTDYNKGLVIEDDYGNQFVWVPVDNVNVSFKKNYNFESIYKPSSINTTNDLLPDGIASEKDSIDKYGGFYVGRYESSFDYNGGNIRAAVKKSADATDFKDWSDSRNEFYNGYLWNYITYNDAKKYAELLPESYGYDTSKVISNLVTGTEWDTLMQWVKYSNKFDSDDSSSYGNYSDSSGNAKISNSGYIHISGYSDNWSINNIYDIAGNLWEWTSELYMDSDNVTRSGSYIYSGKNYPASFRNYNDGTNNYARIGFRIALYIK